ncbi:MAG: shikimate kinase [Eubacteriales bacterium]|nr:shikimate kinase [Eubacteriales bacterium]
MNNIVLIGFMGSGKTTFGRWLKINKKYGFCDTDQYIEKQQQKKIKEIFADDGEKAFRDMETQALKELIGTLENTVISVGGGLPVRKENTRLLKELGTVVYLKTSAEVLLKRLKSDKDRPLLAGGNIKEKIESLMQAREDIYLAAADIVIDTDNLSFEEMFNIIKGADKNEIFSN